MKLLIGVFGVIFLATAFAAPPKQVSRKSYQVIDEGCIATKIQSCFQAHPMVFTLGGEGTGKYAVPGFPNCPPGWYQYKVEDTGQKICRFSLLTKDAFEAKLGNSIGDLQACIFFARNVPSFGGTSCLVEINPHP